MLSTNNNIDFKTATKNLKQELSKMKIELSHSASLNLLSRSLGYADYNTYKAIVDIDSDSSDIDKKVHWNKAIEQYLNDKKNYTKTESNEILTNALYGCGLADNKEIKNACDWIEKIPFTSKYTKVFKYFNDARNDGEYIEFVNANDFKYEMLTAFYNCYIEPFMKPYFSTYDIFEYYKEHHRDSIDSLLERKDLFFCDEISSATGVDLAEFKTAFETALLYDSHDVISGGHISPLLNVVTAIYTQSNRSGDVLHGYLLEDIQEEISRELLESFRSLQYELVLKDTDKRVKFYPFNVINDIKNDNWQIWFNDLFVEHFISNGLMDS